MLVINPINLLALVPLATLHALAALVAPNAINLRLTSNLTHDIPKTLYGYMWEVSRSLPTRVSS